jgi:release factor glutamine methyltransferase
MSDPSGPASAAPERSVQAQLRAADERLTAAGAGSPRVDAELLLAHLLGCRRGQLLLARPLTEDQVAGYAELVRRRAAGVPVQHLTGTAPFRHLELAVGPGVFIPRPETELIIELAAKSLATARTVLDLGAGSGAIALAVAQEYPGRRVIAVEASEQALPWLRANCRARAEAGDSPVEVVAGDLTGPSVLAELAAAVDVVLSNPPYVPERVRAELGVEVGHDPAMAVFAGPDGLAVMPGLLAAAARLLRPGGLLVIEHDESQPAVMLELLRRTGDWSQPSGHPDLTGRARFTSAVRR